MLMTLTGDDTFLINDRPIIPEAGNGDIITLDFPNELFTMTPGKNGNTIYAKNESGSQTDIVCKITRGGKIDKFLNGLMAQQDRDFVAFPVMNGAFTKRLGDGEGNVTYDTYNLQGMMFSKPVPAKANTDGDGDQGMATYTLKAARTTRGLL